MDGYVRRGSRATVRRFPRHCRGLSLQHSVVSVILLRCGSGRPALLDMTRRFCCGCGTIAACKWCLNSRRRRGWGAACSPLAQWQCWSPARRALRNLDQGKSAARLFADGCAACHRSARGLAKDRFSLTLFLFLQKHYASNSSSAWALTSYLESVDSARRGQSRAAAARPSSPATRSSRTLRPPASVPGR